MAVSPLLLWKNSTFQNAQLLVEGKAATDKCLNTLAYWEIEATSTLVWILKKKERNTFLCVLGFFRHANWCAPRPTRHDRCVPASLIHANNMNDMLYIWHSEDQREFSTNGVRTFFGNWQLYHSILG